jgi:MFS family permease
MRLMRSRGSGFHWMAMSAPTVFSFLVVVLTLSACVAAFPEQRRSPVPRWRLALAPLLVAAATLVLLYLPPSNDLREPQLWMLALVAAVGGIVRGALIGLQVDQGTGRLLLWRAREAFWIAVVAALLVLGDLLAEPLGHVGASFSQTVELVLAILVSFLIGRNAALVMRSRDTPHRDL